MITSMIFTKQTLTALLILRFQTHPLLKNVLVKYLQITWQVNASTSTLSTTTTETVTAVHQSPLIPSQMQMFTKFYLPRDQTLNTKLQVLVSAKRSALKIMLVWNSSSNLTALLTTASCSWQTQLTFQMDQVTALPSKGLNQQLPMVVMSCHARTVPALLASQIRSSARLANLATLWSRVLASQSDQDENTWTNQLTRLQCSLCQGELLMELQFKYVQLIQRRFRL